jgi:hypothetical protein
MYSQSQGCDELGVIVRYETGIVIIDAKYLTAYNGIEYS